METKKPTMETKEPTMETNEPTMETKEPTMETKEPTMETKEPTMEFITNLKQFLQIREEYKQIKHRMNELVLRLDEEYENINTKLCAEAFRRPKNEEEYEYSKMSIKRKNRMHAQRKLMGRVGSYLIKKLYTCRLNAIELQIEKFRKYEAILLQHAPSWTNFMVI